MNEAEDNKRIDNDEIPHDESLNGSASNSRDWESGLYAGLMLSLDRYKDRLKEERGFKLNAKPREIDIRIIDQE